MDFSSANTALWNPIIQIGIIAGLILGANVLRRKFAFVRKSLMPTAVLAGFVLLQTNIKRSGVVLSSAFMKLGLIVPMVISVSISSTPLHRCSNRVSGRVATRYR